MIREDLQDAAKKQIEKRWLTVEIKDAFNEPVLKQIYV
jgi:hypothetical protein